ncbi:peptide synthetase, putative [Babesia caballi]|uniref:Peptide synthetase, putative n=1 Tax=Babesia caballi TaxID=5871 RepID=A0AAV4LVU8_BABCB|nr:peptide synthetase, putative [Babesia caballi]
MSAASPHGELLRRTKFAQHGTAYNTLKNTLLCADTRLLYVVDASKQSIRDRQQNAVKRSFTNRRNSRKGPFDRLLPPHAYTNLFGDPAFYSNHEVTRTCAVAAEMGLSDRSFWWQIAEKLRKVRDVMNISDLLRCLESLASVKYFDTDLMRLMTREFIDDMEKLSLPEIAQLLECYARVNVYSVDMVRAAGNAATGHLLTHVRSAVQADGPQDASMPGDVEDPSQWRPETLGILVKCFRSWGYKNRDLYLSIAYLTIKQWRHLDLNSKCAVFANLDPRDFHPEGGTDTSAVSMVTVEEISRETTLSLVRLLSDFSDEFHVQKLGSITDEVDFASIAAGITGSSDEYSKVLHTVCCAAGTVRNLAKVFSRLVDNVSCVSSSVEADTCDAAIKIVMEKLANVSVKLVRFGQELDTVSSGMEHGHATTQTECLEVVPLSNGELTMCPSMNAARHVIVDALMRAACAVNAAVRLRASALISNGEAKSGGDSCGVVPDFNIHSKLYGIPNQTTTTEHESIVVECLMDALETYGCPSQEPELLATALETLALVSKNLQCAPSSYERIQMLHDRLSMGAVKDLVSFGDEARYRIMLALRHGKVTPNVYLENALKNFTKYVRKNCSVKFVLEPPHRFLLRERKVPKIREAPLAA